MVERSTPILQVSNYNVEFWVDGVWYPAAIDMNYEVAAGEVLAIVGESGSGKSSSQMGLMSLLASNARVTGSVKVRGNEMLGENQKQVRKFRGKEVAYIFQEPMTALNPVYTIGFQIVEALQTHMPLSNKQAKQRKDKLKKVSENLISTMKENEIDEFNVKDGKIMYSKTSVKKPITKKNLMSILSKYYKGDISQAVEVNNFILENREEVVKETIKRSIVNKVDVE
jgi:ABC-type microcin C transport system duplicated ATPase subunit YejF